MLLLKNSLRSLFSKKLQFFSVALLIMLTTILYTSITTQNNVMYGSITKYDREQNVEDYGFTPELELNESDFQDIFNKYNISAEDKELFRKRELSTESLIQKYNVNVYDYQKKFVESIKEKYNLEIEHAYNKMVTDTNSKHEYRVFLNEGSINKPYVIEGNMPSKKNETTVSPEYAKLNNLKINDTIEIQNNTYIITGFAYYPAQTYPVVVPSVTKESAVYYPQKQTVMFMTAEGLANISGFPNFDYKCKNVEKLTVGERNAKYHQMDDEIDFKALDNALDSVTHGEVFIRVNGSTYFANASVILFLATCSLISMLTIKRRIEADRKQIGILKALGHSSREIALAYTPFGIIASLLGSVMGYIIGILVYPLFISGMYENYNLPISAIPFDYRTLLLVIIVPLVLLTAVCLITALVNLKKAPLELMNNNPMDAANNLGEFVSKVLKKARFETRFKYQSACRSVSKLAAMLVIGFCASLLLYSAIMIQPAFSNMINKTFKGIDSSNIVIFKDNKNIEANNVRYSDEEVATIEDLYILKISHKNGAIQDFDDTNKSEAEVIGIDSDNKDIHLLSENGDEIKGKLNSGIVINQVIAGKYNLSVGDKLLLNSTPKNVQVEFNITGIADQYSGNLIYFDREMLNKIFRYPTGTYNAVFSDHQYELSDKEVKKVFAVSSFKEGLKKNFGTMRTLSTVVIVFAVIISTVMIIVSANLVVEENKKNISMLKVLGYSNSEISNLVVNIYTPILIISSLLSIPVSITMMKSVCTVLENKFETPLPAYMNLTTALLGIGILLITYFICLQFSKRSIDKVILAESLRSDS